MMQGQSQHIIRVKKLDNNLKDQIDWLSLNLEKSYFSGFNYAHKVSKDISAPTVFNFDNPSKRASNSSTLASISEIGDFELQSFRINSNLRSDIQRDSAERPANANGHSSNSSASFSYDADEHLNGGDQEQHRSSSSYRPRPSVGSFLGGQGAANGFLPGDRSRDRDEGRQSGSGNGNFNRSNNNTNSSSSGYGDQSGNSSSSSSSGYNNMSRGLHTGSSSAYNSYSTARDPPSSSSFSSSSSSSTGPVEAYSTCISDSQLAVLDIEGITCALLTATVL